MSERELYPSEKQERFIVRLPDGMRDRIKAAADANNRSMNAEIVATLQDAYPEVDDFQKLVEDALMDGKPREALLMGARAVILPRGRGFRVTTTNMPIPDLLAYLEEHGPNALPPDSPE